MSMSCCNCGTTVGGESKHQPTTVTPADGRGASETWCPRCFVWHRMVREPERFNASQTCAARCQFCGVTMVCYGAARGRGLMCTACGRFGAMRIPMTAQALDEMVREMRNVAEESRAKQPRSRA